MSKSRVPRWIGDVWILAIIGLITLGVTRIRIHTRTVEKRAGVVAYDTTVDKESALKLADALVRFGYFGGGRAQANLSREEDRYNVKFVADPKLADQNPTLVQQLRQLVRPISEAAFGQDQPTGFYLMAPNGDVFMDLTEGP